MDSATTSTSTSTSPSTSIDWLAGSERITAESLASGTAELASDEFEGRLPASSGEEKTMRFLRREFGAIGFTDAEFPTRERPFVQEGEGGRKLFMAQEVPLIEITPRDQSSLAVTNIVGGSANAADPIEFKYLDEFCFYTTRSDVERHEVKDSEIVFAGYGVVAPEYGWNDFANIDVRGKTILVLVNDPGFASGDTTFFDGRAMTYYGRWTYKYEEGERQGAAAVLIIHWSSAAAGYSWHVPAHSKSGPHFSLEEETQAGSPLKGWVTEQTARKLFERAGVDYDAEIKAAGERASGGYRVRSLGQQCSLGLRSDIKRLTSSNALAFIEGSSKKEEVVVLSGHWDHFGKRGDDIFNGARDNALAVIALIELAKAFLAIDLKLRERSILIFSATAEEQGLLGAFYYAQNPLIPLDRTVAVLNMDMLNIFGRTKDIAFFGLAKSELDQYAAWASDLQGRTMDRQEPVSESGLFYRSDHFAFARYGVPGLFMFQGYDHVTKGRDWLVARNKKWVEDCYHKPSDVCILDKSNEWCWDLSGAEEDVRLLFLIAKRLIAEGSKPYPQWKPAAEFRRK